MKHIFDDKKTSISGFYSNLDKKCSFFYVQLFIPTLSFSKVRQVFSLGKNFTKMAEFHFIDRGYGKFWVKMLHLERNGNIHTIKEYEVNTQLTLDSEKDYKTVKKIKKS